MLLSGKELRAFGLRDFLRQRFDRLYDEHLAELRNLARRRLRVSLLGNLATTVVLAGIVAGLLLLALDGRIGLADAGTATAAVFVLGGRLMNAMFSAGMLYEPSLFIEDFTSFVAMAPRVEARRSRLPAPAGFRRLRVEDVASPTRAPPSRPSRTCPWRSAPARSSPWSARTARARPPWAKLLCRLYMPHRGPGRPGRARAVQEHPDAVPGRSVLLISHRFSSVRSAVRIYVLDGGRVVESGSHEELMALGGRYADLFALQASAYLGPRSS
jgi:ABC-type multidrug transport system fused ATPase/permease subunit